MKIFWAMLFSSLTFNIVACSSAMKREGFLDSSPHSFCRTAQIDHPNSRHYEKIVISDDHVKIEIEPIELRGTTFFGPVLIPFIPIKWGVSKTFDLDVFVEIIKEGGQVDLSSWTLKSGDETLSPTSSKNLLVKTPGIYRLEFKLEKPIADRMILTTNSHEIVLERARGTWSYYPLILPDILGFPGPLACENEP